MKNQHTTIFSPTQTHAAPVKETARDRGPVIPRCLAALPLDIEAILNEFKKQQK